MLSNDIKHEETTMAYYRITGYDTENDIGFIADSNGRFEKLWQFSSYLLLKGFKVLAVSKEDKFKFGNLPKASHNDKIILRCCDFGKPVQNGNKFTVKGKTYEVIP